MPAVLFDTSTDGAEAVAIAGAYEFDLMGLQMPVLDGYGVLPPDRLRRRPLYDLYHALNHLNLFGAGYLAMVRRCLAGIDC